MLLLRSDNSSIQCWLFLVFSTAGFCLLSRLQLIDGLAPPSLLPRTRSGFKQQQRPSMLQLQMSTQMTVSANPTKSPEDIQKIRKALESCSFFAVANGTESGSILTPQLIDAFEKVTIRGGSTAESSPDDNDGKIICRQGEPGDYFYIIHKGLVQFLVDGKDVGMMGEEETFGELALMVENSTRAATAEAVLKEDGIDDDDDENVVELWRLDRPTFRKLLFSSFDENDTENAVDSSSKKAAKAFAAALDVYTRRVELKRKLQEATILLMGTANNKEQTIPDHYCEDIMEELEPLSPISRPAYSQSMNGDWCMVQAGERTIDMTLISILSTMSRLLPWNILDFQDCYITLTNNATMVQCNIFLQLFGGLLPFKMNTYTSMKKDDEHPTGSLMYEKFQGYSVSNIPLYIPEALAGEARPLLITYLDQDIMIARNPNSGGQPHLLVRIRSCPDSDPDHKYTGFFEEARRLYGNRITRCLVDRSYGTFQSTSTQEGTNDEDFLNILMDAARAEDNACPVKNRVFSTD